jgi:hypothetical protein
VSARRAPSFSAARGSSSAPRHKSSSSLAPLLDLGAEGATLLARCGLPGVVRSRATSEGAAAHSKEQRSDAQGQEGLAAAASGMKEGAVP